MSVTSKSIACIFSSRADAEKASREIKKAGLRIDNISIIENESANSDGQYNEPNYIYNVPLGFGAAMDPEMGMISGAGPAAGLVSGIGFLNVGETLMNLGHTTESAAGYESHLKSGSVYFSMPVTNETGGAVSSILRKNGAEELEIIRH